MKVLMYTSQINMKKLILALFLALLVITLPKAAYAQTTTVQPGVCVSVYGGGVVCGAKHEVVDTAFGDINPAILGVIFTLASGALFLLSRKMRKFSSQISA